MIFNRMARLIRRLFFRPALNQDKRPRKGKAFVEVVFLIFSKKKGHGNHQGVLQSFNPRARTGRD
ncbi:MAG: hypothetical protein PHP98_09715, partial [Kiritimatiellae bacterium]|nr:hypothetical protein [Kiritimatiellia bacterium]